MDEQPVEPESSPTLLGLDVTIVAPSSAAERWDVASAAHAGAAPQRTMALALGLSWPRLRRRLASEGIRYTGDPMGFGGRVFDWLIGQGAVYSEIVDAGQLALQACVRDLPGAALPRTDAERAELLGNSQGSEG